MGGALPKVQNSGNLSGAIATIPTPPKVYGAVWDGSDTTSWTRTHDAAGFADPVPYVAGASSCGSPFEDIQPWAGMIKTERAGGTMVAIPKFWYSLTSSGESPRILISAQPVPGFSVSPAHVDRGDGKGERDVVYIGRYHCGESGYKSAAGQKPKAGVTIGTARTEIHKLGANIWQMDFAMRFTVWLLYLVEFADWNSQKMIGKGCGNNSGTEKMGYTDLMPYHTGTTQSGEDAYGLGTQYRYIEGLWDNVMDWCDGCCNASDGFRIILNPNHYGDTDGGKSVGTFSSGIPSKFMVRGDAGSPVFVPLESKGSANTGSCDRWNFAAQYPFNCVGGGYLQNDIRGMFGIANGLIDGTSDYIGARIQELP